MMWKKIRKKPKIFFKVIQRFLVCKTCWLKFFFSKPSEAAKDSNLVKICQCCKKKPWPNNLEECNKNFLFLLGICLFGGLAETSSNHFEQKSQKIPCTETGIAQPLQQVHRSSWLYMTDKKNIPIFFWKRFNLIWILA